MKFYKVAIIGLLLGLLVPVVVFAQDWEIAKGSRVIRQDETVSGDLYFSGDYLEISGVVQGDLLVFAREVKLTGIVEGDFLGLVGEKFTVEGKIGGDLRGFAQQLEIGGTVAETMTAAGLQGEFAPTAQIGKGLIGKFHTVKFLGNVVGSTSITGYVQTELGGKIEGSLELRGVPATWNETMEISGDVNDYTGNTDTSQVNRIKLGGDYRIHQDTEALVKLRKQFFLLSLIWFMGCLLMAIILYKLFPRTVWQLSEPNFRRLQLNLLKGLAAAFGIPLLIVLLIISRVGIPLAILLSLGYIMVLLFSNVILCLWSGRLIFAKTRFNQKRYGVMLILIGGLVLSFAGMIPVVGLILPVVAFGMAVSFIQPEKEEISR